MKRKINVVEKKIPGPPQPGNGAHIFKGEHRPKAQVGDHDKITFQAVIINVNTDINTMDVRIVGSTKIVTDVTLMSSYTGPGGFLGVCPEPGCFVSLIKDDDDLVPIAYYIPQPEFALSCELMGLYPESTADETSETQRLIEAKYRRLRPGEGRFASSQGSEIFLDEDVEITDSMDNGIRVRSGDGSIISTSQQNFMFANGVWRSSGPIQRNSLITEVVGQPLSGYEITKVVHSDGTKSIYIGGNYEYKGRVYNEYRIEVEDTNFLDKPVNDVNEGLNTIIRKPRTEFIMGNMVGNDESDLALYGKFLAPSFFGDIKGEGSYRFEALLPNGDEDVLGRRGVAVALHVPKKAFFGFDKMGANHVYLGSAGSAGLGVSQFLVAQGGRKEEWGVSREGGLSWDMYCQGGISWTVGGSIENPTTRKIGRSASMRFLEGTYTEHGYSSDFKTGSLNDMDGNSLSHAKIIQYKKIDRVAGKAREEIKGDYEIDVEGDLVESIGGSRIVSIGGSLAESLIGDRTLSTSGALTFNAITEMKTNTAKRTETIVKGNDSKTILLGNEELSIAVGKQVVTVAAGNIERTVTVGSIKDSVVTGNKSTSITAGNYSLDVSLGNISANASVGNVSIGGMKVDISALTKINLSALTVSIGNAATQSGVITQLSHHDYITGLPLIPSLTVTAGL